MVDEDPEVWSAPGGRRRRRWRWLAAAGGVATVALGLVWAERVDIARRLIDRQVRQLKLAAHYRIDAIGPRREVLSNIAFGDPAHPDLTVETIEIATGWRGGLPAITAVTVIGARLHGRVADGQVSFGSLDAWLRAPASAPLRLPDVALTLRDARVSLGGGQGPIGLAIGGDGNLRDGFAGAVALVAPGLRGQGCVARAAQFAGRLTIAGARPRLTGPLRLAAIACPARGLALAAPTLTLDLRGNAALDGGAGGLVLATGAAAAPGVRAAALHGQARVRLGDGAWAAAGALSAAGIVTPAARAQTLNLAGQLRGAGAGLAGEGTLTGRDIAPDRAAPAALARAGAAGAGTMVAPLLAGLRGGLARTAGSTLAATWTLRRDAGGVVLTLPGAAMVAPGAGRWLTLGGVTLRPAAGGGLPALAGTVALGGAGLPAVRAWLTPLPAGGGTATLTMPEWRAGAAALAVPGLAMRWTGAGALRFAGAAVASGAVPGGRIDGLRVPLTGGWSAAGGLRLGERCAALGFAGLAVGVARFGPTAAAAPVLCPPAGGAAMATLDRRGLRLALRSAGLHLAGRLAQSPVTVTTGALALDWPGAATARDIALTLRDPAGVGAPAGASPGVSPGVSRVHLAALTARLGSETTGTFAGGDIALAGTPAAVRALAGGFRWAGGRLSVAPAAFRIEDPAAQPAFAPIVAGDATLTLTDGVVSAAASLHPAAAATRALARVSVVHDLARGRGHADVTIPGLAFDKALQPKQLSPLAEGMIADVRGTLDGAGRFDWDGAGVTSHGWLASGGLDFAAPFGPVKGVAGRIEFTDLLGLVTAPGQRLTIAAINPGIEVDDGVATFAMQPGHVLVVDGARWPFLDGTLALLPTRLALGAAEARRYELRVEGLNAAKFVARMDLSNLAATGTFDGNLPLVFDAGGGHIDNGVLLSRPPGGTVSYVGELSYKDLSPMANYAFQALRALKYRQMRIGMNGALAGDIVTRVSMQGVGQGAGAKRNFITNQIARLPIRFDVTITAPFMQLLTSFRSLYDPALAADPRTLGLIDAQGRPIAHPAAPPVPAAPPPPQPKAIQP